MRKLARILHVEDDPDILSIAKMALEGLHGFEVMACSDWKEAVDKAPEFRPDLFLLDVMMPQKSGPETLAELRRLPGFADTPAIFMTAKVQEDEVARFLAAGAIAVVTKPFDPMALGDEIRAVWMRMETAA